MEHAYDMAIEVLGTALTSRKKEKEEIPVPGEAFALLGSNCKVTNWRVGHKVFRTLVFWNICKLVKVMSDISKLTRNSYVIPNAFFKFL